jgi:hypothetical protein
MEFSNPSKRLLRMSSQLNNSSEGAYTSTKIFNLPNVKKGDRLVDYIDLIIFDMAGTTVRDLEEVEGCFYEAMKRSGLDVSR